MSKVIKILLIAILSVFFFSCIGKDENSNTEYTVTYELNGGTLNGEIPLTFKPKDKVVLPECSKEGYIFVGWYNGEVFISELTSGDVNITATFIEPMEYDVIEEDMLFNQKYTEYFIYIYRDGCAWCNKIKEDVQKYIYKTSLDCYKSSIKVFVINLTKDGKRSKIFRTYQEEDYDEGYEGFYVSKAKKYDEIYIPSTPALLKVEANDDNVHAYCLAKGASTVVSEMNKGLIEGTDEREKRPFYEISYDLNGGTSNDELVTIFYSWSKIKLPVLTKERYVFVGWYEDDQLVIKVENRNYNLKAKFKELIEPQTIKASEIFTNQESHYYVLFVNKEANNYNEIVELCARFNIINNEGILIYFVDILDSDNKAIKRSYFGDDGQSATGRFYVDGVTNWEDLYIPKAPGLIEISIIEDKKTAKYLSDGIDCLDFIENILSQ